MPQESHSIENSLSSHIEATGIDMPPHHSYNALTIGQRRSVAFVCILVRLVICCGCVASHSKVEAGGWAIQVQNNNVTSTHYLIDLVLLSCTSTLCHFALPKSGIFRIEVLSNEMYVHRSLVIPSDDMLAGVICILKQS